MTYYDNWAVFARGTSVLWSFGQIDEEKALIIANLAKGLHDAARELFNECVTAIQLADGREVLFVQIGEGDFFFIASDPLTTAKLLRLTKIPSNVESSMLGVLIGHGVQTYANLWSAAQSDFHAELIDNIFQEALDQLALPEDANVNIGIHQGSCNLSGLSLPDLIFFHSYVRRRIGEERNLDPKEQWGFVQAAAGAPIPLEYKIATANINILLTTGLISVIVTIIQEVFRSSPQKIVFADEHIPALDLIVSDDYFLAASHAIGLFKDPEFLELFFNLPEEVTNSLEVPLKEVISDEIIAKTRTTLQNKDIHELIEEFKHLEAQVLTEPASRFRSPADQLGRIRSDPREALMQKIEALSSMDPLVIPSRPLKLILVGDGAVGKTSLKNVFLGKGFDSSYLATMGVDFAAKTIRLAGKEIRTQIWDLAGQPSFKQVRSSFYAGAHAAIAVFDVVQRETLASIQEWIAEIWSGTKTGPVPVLILGNKIDLRENDPTALNNDEIQRAIFDWIQANEEYKLVPIAFLPTSAKSGENVQLAFQAGCAQALIAIQRKNA